VESDFLSLPYADRQLVVLPRPVVREDSPEPPRRAPSLLAGKAAAALVPLGSLIMLASAGVAAGAGAVVNRAGRRLNPTHVRPITAEEAAELRLPIGHPRYDTVYVGHPASPPVYFPYADFHRRTFEHKFAEAMRLLTSLGASTLQVSALQGWDRSFGSKIGMPIPGLEPVGGQAESESSVVQGLLYRATLSGDKRPIMPEELVWAGHEPSWLELARQRLHHGLRSFELQVSYQDHFEITAELAAKLNGAGLQIGGDFEHHTATVWMISGEFPEALPDQPTRTWFGALRRRAADPD
jgi:hypothetical protein